MIKNSKEPTQEDLHNWLLKRTTATNREITDQFNDTKDAKYIYIKPINLPAEAGKTISTPPDPVQLEKDCIISDTLERITQIPFLREHLSLYGGTALKHRVDMDSYSKGRRLSKNPGFSKDPIHESRNSSLHHS